MTLSFLRTAVARASLDRTVLGVGMSRDLYRAKPGLVGKRFRHDFGKELLPDEENLPVARRVRLLKCGLGEVTLAMSNAPIIERDTNLQLHRRFFPTLRCTAGLLPFGAAFVSPSSTLEASSTSSTSKFLLFLNFSRRSYGAFTITKSPLASKV